ELRNLPAQIDRDSHKLRATSGDPPGSDPALGPPGLATRTGRRFWPGSEWGRRRLRLPPDRAPSLPMGPAEGMASSSARVRPAQGQGRPPKSNERRAAPPPSRDCPARAGGGGPVL